MVRYPRVTGVPQVPQLGSASGTYKQRLPRLLPIFLHNKRVTHVLSESLVTLLEYVNLFFQLIAIILLEIIYTELNVKEIFTSIKKYCE